jgi:hypothetical protein
MGSTSRETLTFSSCVLGLGWGLLGSTDSSTLPGCIGPQESLRRNAPGLLRRRIATDTFKELANEAPGVLNNNKARNASWSSRHRAAAKARRASWLARGLQQLGLEPSAGCARQREWEEEWPSS